MVWYIVCRGAGALDPNNAVEWDNQYTYCIYEYITVMRVCMCECVYECYIVPLVRRWLSTNHTDIACRIELQLFSHTQMQNGTHDE